MAKVCLSVTILALFIATTSGTTPHNPFCGYTKERNTVTVSLVCVNGVINNIIFAAFGTPTGQCPNYTASPSCDDPTFAAYARSTCVGKSSCTLESQGDPCGGVVKSIAVVANCSLGPGGYQPAPPLPAPSCAVNGLPCPVPDGWAEDPAVWNLTQSTAIQPSSSGYFIPTHPWGLISLDWSVANRIWYQGNTSNTTCEAVSTAGCQLLKEVCPLHITNVRNSSKFSLTSVHSSYREGGERQREMHVCIWGFIIIVVYFIIEGPGAKMLYLSQHGIGTGMAGVAAGGDVRPQPGRSLPTVHGWQGPQAWPHLQRAPRHLWSV